MRKIVVYVALCLGLLSLAACQEEGIVSPDNIFVSSDVRQACAAQNGVLVHGSQPGTVVCAEKLPDAGKTCRYSGECAGVCMASELTPTATTGMCQPARPYYGCVTMVGLVEENKRVCLGG
ncbi:hypothetical protein [Chachezhania sediminis]|uniref:hypothetical protein n=1 Tax=Chachezhania sediminis TaxID=2599291 RepID=UPI00131C37CB|nr:hypothetical protein [Chachezhania sediminis]